MTRPEPALARELEAALSWWQAAGVTYDFTDDATAWLADAPMQAAAAQTGAAHAKTVDAGSPQAQIAARTRPAPPAEPPRPARRDLMGESPPGDLPAFRDWWMNAPELDTARTFPRIAPRGPEGAALMVLVPQPEEGDRERLLDGPQGRLLSNIVAATGLEQGAVYVASALPCHTPMADLSALAAGGMDAVTAHHISLVAPQRVLVLGTALGPMLGAADANGLREINHNSGKLPVMVSETLEAMMDMPRLKARFWRRWMEWTASR
jgi:DNA polymerase